MRTSFGRKTGVQPSFDTVVNRAVVKVVHESGAAVIRGFIDHQHIGVADVAVKDTSVFAHDLVPCSEVRQQTTNDNADTYR